MIDSNIIKQRKKVYGNNFPCIAKKWSAILGIEVEPKDVALLMAELKSCREDYIRQKLLEKVDTKLISALEDTQKDKANYEYIAYNYEEYEKL